MLWAAARAGPVHREVNTFGWLSLAEDVKPCAGRTLTIFWLRVCDFSPQHGFSTCLLCLVFPSQPLDVMVTVARYLLLRSILASASS